MCCLLEKVPIRSLFHSKMGHHFYKFRNPLHVGAVHDALDNIGLFQSVCGQFKLIKVFCCCRKLQFLKKHRFFSLTIENPSSPMVDCKTIDSMAMVRWSKTIEKPSSPMVDCKTIDSMAMVEL